MTTNAGNFVSRMKEVWAGKPGLRFNEEDANIAACQYGAVRLGAFHMPTEVYAETPGDMPASLWRFRDGSTYVIGNNGNWLHAPRRTRGPLLGELVPC